MSLASQATLISPTATTHSVTSSHAHHPHGHQHPRRQSSHSAHHAHAHAHMTTSTKRRTSSHTAPNGHSGPSRRPSEGDSGRRALAAGLQMHTVEQHVKPKRKGSGDRPLSKASRSDSHLPRLSRTTSVTSNVSHTSDRPNRPSKPRKRSGESVQILSEDGQEVEAEASEEGEGWESGEDQADDGKGDDALQMGKKGKSRGTEGSITASAGMQRSKSDSHAEVVKQSEKNAADSGIVPPAPAADSQHAMHRQRTTGFPGAPQTPDPSVAAAMDGPHGHGHGHGHTHPYNDQMHVMPAHQVKHQQSARSMHSLALADDKPNPSHKASAASLSRASSGRSEAGPVRSTDGSGLAPGVSGPSENTAYPFPKMNSPEALKPSHHPLRQSSQPYPTPPVSTAPDSPPSPTREKDVRVRLPSAPVLRHRHSNSSLRSLQSLRMPPHPLNSPTGYRTGMLPPSRPGSVISPRKAQQRGPSMHHPPIAPPVVYREVANGTGWDLPEDQVASVSTLASASHNRRTSSSSARSLQHALGRGATSPAPSVSTVTSLAPPPHRRQTALEAASKASKLHTTTDPALYHHSLGYSASSAETAHLISRFLPVKTDRKITWEVDLRRGLEVAEDDEEDGEHEMPKVGLTRGDYRTAHESLVRMMREMGVGDQSRRRAASRAAGGEADGVLGVVGRVKGGQGVVKRGADWGGKTPFEMGFERCLAQRPAGV